MVSRRAIRSGFVTAVAATAAVLLSATSVTHAGWYDAETIPGEQISTGALSVDELPATAAVAGTNSGATTGLVPGDKVTFTAPVRVEAVGNTLEATLSLDASAAFPDLDVSRPVVRTAGGDALPSTGTNTWAVTPALNDETVTATIVATVPASAKPGTAYAAGELRWSLTQDGLTEGGWASAATHATPAVSVAELGFEVTPSGTSAVVTNSSQRSELDWRVSGVQVTVDGGARRLSGTTLAYRVTDEAGSCQAAAPAWSAVVDRNGTVAAPPEGPRSLAGGTSSTVCIDAQAADRYSWWLDGEIMTVHTELTAGQGSHAVTEKWTTEYVVTWRGFLIWGEWVVEPYHGSAADRPAGRSAPVSDDRSQATAASESATAGDGGERPATTPEPDGEASAEPESSSTTREPQVAEPDDDQPSATEPKTTEPEPAEPEATEAEPAEPKSLVPGSESDGTEVETPEPIIADPDGVDAEPAEPEGTEPEGTESSDPVAEQPEAAPVDTLSCELADGAVVIDRDVTDDDAASTWEVLPVEESGETTSLTGLLRADDGSTHLSVDDLAGEALRVRVHLAGSDEFLPTDAFGIETAATPAGELSCAVIDLALEPAP